MCLYASTLSTWCCTRGLYPHFVFALAHGNTDVCLRRVGSKRIDRCAQLQVLRFLNLPSRSEIFITPTIHAGIDTTTTPFGEEMPITPTSKKVIINSIQQLSGLLHPFNVIRRCHLGRRFELAMVDAISERPTLGPIKLILTHCLIDDASPDSI